MSRATPLIDMVTLDDLKAPVRYALNGGPFGSNLVSADYTDEGVPVIRGVNLAGDSSFSFKDLVFVSEEKADRLLPNNAHPGDLVFTQRGTLGQVGIIPDASPYERFVISQSQMKLTVDAARVDPYFLYCYFRSPATIHTIHNTAISAGVPHINLAMLRQFRVALPPMPVQKRVASIVFTYDDLIENNLRRIQILEEMARAIYREWFVDFRSPEHERVRTVESALGPIPEGWECIELGDIAHEVRKSVDPRTVARETPYVGLEHLPRRSVALDDWGTATQVDSMKLQFSKGQILFGKIRPYFHKVSVAPVDGVCSSDIIVISPDDPEFCSLVLASVSSDEFVSFATRTSQGTKMPRANWDVLAKYPIPLPPRYVLAHFNSIVRNIVESIQNLVLRTRSLRATRDFLLPKLISGEIEVGAAESEFAGVVA
jgi:type I restriction enzyme, S subunit